MMIEPFWVINDQGEFNLYESNENFYLRQGKYIPLPEGKIWEAGLVSPRGDFYACTFASHSAAGLKICQQLGFLTLEDDDEWMSTSVDRDAKGILYEKGWAIINSAGCGYIKSKWMGLEEMPKPMMNIVYDWIKTYRSSCEDIEDIFIQPWGY